VIDPVDQPEYEGHVNDLREMLGDEEFSTNWNEGEAMDLDEAVEDGIVG
jgi:hypothetical protein